MNTNYKYSGGSIIINQSTEVASTPVTSIHLNFGNVHMKGFRRS